MKKDGKKVKKTQKTVTVKRPSVLRTKNLFAKCHIDCGRVVVEISDMASWRDLGASIPTDAEIEKFSAWIKKVRNFHRNRKKVKNER